MSTSTDTMKKDFDIRDPSADFRRRAVAPTRRTPSLLSRTALALRRRRPDVTDFTDEAVSTAAERLSTEEPLAAVFGDAPRVRVLSALLAADRPLAETDLLDRADLPREVWPAHRERLRAVGLIARTAASAADEGAHTSEPAYGLANTELARAVERVANLAGDE